MQDASLVCNHLKIPHLTLDWENIFKERVIDYFIKSHEIGLTPNPCAICNKEVKTAFLSFYLKQVADIDSLATGHYIIKEQNHIKRAKHKDQSYFMALIPKYSIKNLMFPIGYMTKDETRKIAKEAKLPVADKIESQDVCFLKGMNLEDYLDNYLILEEGNIIHIKTKKILGTHKGLYKYTIGQRRGLNISYHVPLYVIEKDIKNNILYVGEKELLEKTQIVLKDYNMLEDFEKNNMYVQIRYNAPPAKIQKIEQNKDNILITLEEPVYQLAPGQIGAIYYNDILIGGGIIV